MIEKEIRKLMIAMTMFIEAKTANLNVENKYEKLRLKDFARHVESQGLNLSESNDPSWPDDFEEDWE